MKRTRFESAAHENDPAIKSSFAGALCRGAAVVIKGNNCHYGWFALQCPDRNPDSLRGIREFAVGTDGKHSYRSFGKIRPNSEIRQADTFGVLKLSLHASSYNWEFVPEAGKGFHYLSGGSGH
jgi:hypothetical protein